MFHEDVVINQRKLMFTQIHLVPEWLLSGLIHLNLNTFEEKRLNFTLKSGCQLLISVTLSSLCRAEGNFHAILCDIHSYISKSRGHFNSSSSFSTAKGINQQPRKDDSYSERVISICNFSPVATMFRNAAHCNINLLSFGLCLTDPV